MQPSNVGAAIAAPIGDCAPQIHTLDRRLLRGRSLRNVLRIWRADDRESAAAELGRPRESGVPEYRFLGASAGAVRVLGVVSLIGFAGSIFGAYSAVAQSDSADRLNDAAIALEQHSIATATLQSWLACGMTCLIGGCLLLLVAAAADALRDIARNSHRVAV